MVSGMVFLQIGPLTSLLEATATAVAAGILLGSAGMGAVGIALGWPKRKLEGRALTDGYYGGIFGAVLALADAVARYIVK